MIKQRKKASEESFKPVFSDEGCTLTGMGVLESITFGKLFDTFKKKYPNGNRKDLYKMLKYVDKYYPKTMQRRELYKFFKKCFPTGDEDQFFYWMIIKSAYIKEILDIRFGPENWEYQLGDILIRLGDVVVQSSDMISTHVMRDTYLRVYSHLGSYINFSLERNNYSIRELESYCGHSHCLNDSGESYSLKQARSMKWCGGDYDTSLHFTSFPFRLDRVEKSAIQLGDLLMQITLLLSQENLRSPYQIINRMYKQNVGEPFDSPDLWALAPDPDLIESKLKHELYIHDHFGFKYPEFSINPKSVLELAKSNDSVSNGLVIYSYEDKLYMTLAKGQHVDTYESFKEKVLLILKMTTEYEKHNISAENAKVILKDFKAIKFKGKIIYPMIRFELDPPRVTPDILIHQKYIEFYENYVG